MLAGASVGETLSRSEQGKGLILPRRSSALQLTLQAMLQHDPAARPSAQDLVFQVGPNPCEHITIPLLGHLPLLFCAT